MGVATHAGFGVGRAADSLRRLRSRAHRVLGARGEAAAAAAHALARDARRRQLDGRALPAPRARRRSASRASSTGRSATRRCASSTCTTTADAVIAVSDKERELLADFLGDDRVFTVPLAEHIERVARSRLRERRGMYFVGELPPRAQPGSGRVPVRRSAAAARSGPARATSAHGHRQLARRSEPRHRPERTRAFALVGWVPSVQPYLERSRISVVPLLHGAGVKRKVLQSMMAGTPVVTTPVGAEGLDLVAGRARADRRRRGRPRGGHHAPAHRRRRSGTAWPTNGAAHVDARHGVERRRRRFADIVERVMARPAAVAPRGRRQRAPVHRRRRRHGGRSPRAGPDDRRARERSCSSRRAATRRSSTSVRSRLALPAGPRRRVGGLRTGRRTGRDQPPRSATHARRALLRAARSRRSPGGSGSPSCIEHLERAYRRVHQDEHLVVVRPRAGRDRDVRRSTRTPSSRVQVLGTYAADRTGPPTGLVTELGRSAHGSRSTSSGGPTPRSTKRGRRGTRRRRTPTTSCSSATTPSCRAASSTS